MKKVRRRSRSNSTLAIFAGCAVAFMIIATIISVIFYRRNLVEVQNLLKDREKEEFNSYVIFIAEDKSQGFWNDVYLAAQKKGQEEGVCIDRIDDAFNVHYTKNQLLEIAINSGCDGILVEADNSKKTTNLINEAIEAGIVVVTMQNDSVDSNRTSFVGTSNYNLSKLYATKIIDTIHGYTGENQENAKVLVLNGKGFSTENVADIITGMQEEIAKSDSNIPNLSFESALINESDDFAIEEYVQNLFINNTLPDVIVCLDSTTTSSVYQAIIDYNRVGEIDLLGFYHSNTIFDGIEQNVINSTVTFDANDLGVLSERAFREYFETGYVSDYIVVNNRLIDSENVKKFREELIDEKEN